MKPFHVARWLIVYGVASVMAWFLPALVSAAEEKQAGNLPSATELEEFRQNFMKNFKRIAINTAPEDAALLRILVECSRAQRGIEVGTATGYGAIHMGLGFERNGGHLTTIDISPKMVDIARDNIQKMRLQDSVTVVEGDALEVIPKLEGQFDFIFIDAVKKDYLKYFKAAEPKLKPGSVIVADNAIKSAHQMRDFLQTVEKDPNYRCVIVQASELKDDGMAVIYKVK